MLRSTLVVTVMLTYAWRRTFNRGLSQAWPVFNRGLSQAWPVFRKRGPDKLKWLNKDLKPWYSFANGLKQMENVEYLASIKDADSNDNDPLYMSDLFQGDAPIKPSDAAMSIYIGDHDAHIAVSKNGRLQCILELERLFDVRYTGGSINVTCKLTYGEDWCLENDEEFHNNTVLALRTVKQRCDIDDGAFPEYFDRVFLNVDQVQPFVREVFDVGSFWDYGHHWGHGLMAAHASPFKSPLVISYDGSPGDQFHVYHGIEGRLQHVAKKVHKICEFYLQTTFLPFKELENEVKRGKNKEELGNPGKFMGYAGVGKPEPRLEMVAHDILGGYLDRDTCAVVKDFGQISRSQARSYMTWQTGNITFERAVAASIQSAWEDVLFCQVSKYLEAVGRDHVDGIVLVGGGALNVMANQFVYDQVTASHQIGVYVPPAPGDNGVALGALLMDNAKMQIPNNWQYLGFRLWDAESLSNAALEWDARQLSSIGGVDYLAELLAGGQPWLQERTSNASRPIIAIVRGRQEFGPRALGHRSLVAVPDSENIRDRLNTLKYRAWWRPAAPMIADESLEEVFGRVVKSPYMTMAPKVRDEIRDKYPAICHFDGTARHQSVGHDDEPWIHALLMAVGKRTGLGALINTSFNRKGRPIVNTVKESLLMLSEEKDLDYVLIEDYLFKKKA